MKKILSLAMIIFIGGMLFGQSAKYTNLVNLAKQYEDQKQYIFALGTYYDAIEEDQINCTEAAEAYEKLSSLIASGKPGNGNFGKFELHDEWKKVLLDAERYWAENPIIGIKIKNVSQDSIDYNTKTANYKIEYNYYFTEKYKVIRNIIVSGCEKAGSKSWSDFPELSDWPRTSVLTVNDGSTDGIYKKYKIPLLKDSETNYHSPYFSTSVINFKKYEAKSWEELGFQSAIIEQMEALEINFIVNDVKFGVFDRNNKLLFSGTRQLVKKSKDTYSYIIQKVPQNIIKLIDNNQVEIKLAGFYIQYGVLAKKEIYIPSYNSYNRSSATANFLKEVNDSLSDESLRSLVAKLPDIAVNTDKIEKSAKENVIEVSAKAREELKLKNGYIEKIKKAFDSNDFKTVNSLLAEAKSKSINVVAEDLGVTEKEYYIREISYVINNYYKNKDFENAHKALKTVFDNGYEKENLLLDTASITNTYKAEVQKLLKKNSVVEVSKLFEFANLIGIEKESIGWDEKVIEKALKAEIQEKYNNSDYKGTLAAIDYLTDGLGKTLVDLKLQKDLRERAQKKYDDAEAKFAAYRKPIEEKFVEIPDLGILMSSVEVTQKFYLQIMKKDPSQNKEMADAILLYVPVSGTRPVDSVSWNDAVAFCNELSIKAGLEPAYVINGKNVTWIKSANGYRLPTASEWFTVAKAKTDYRFSGSNDLSSIAWYNYNANSSTHEIGQKKPNSYGLYDMNGNVWEWCWDVSKNGIHGMMGGGYDDSDYKYFELVDDSFWVPKDNQGRDDIGFRICRNKE